MKVAVSWREGRSLMPERMMSTRPVRTAESICSKLVSCHCIRMPSFAAMALPSSMSKPVSSPVCGFFISSGG